jgi:hypothetical protein
MSIVFSSPRGGACPPLVVVPRSDLEVERQCAWPAFHNLLHHVLEDDGYVCSLGSSQQNEAAAERLRMSGLNAISHFLSRDGIADECIPEADFLEALHVLLSEIGLDEVPERTEELP